jgi:cellulose biosynthesis protein BcsQ
MISVAFFNNKGGVGKTTLVYHLGWAFADEGLRVLLADFDSQSNLSAMCVDEDRLEQLWVDDEAQRRTVFGSVRPIKEELGDIAPAHIEPLHPNLGLVVGDIQLASFETKLSESWPKCVDHHVPSLRATSSFHRLIREAGQRHGAVLALIDVGPNLGAINRAALLAADWIVTPLGADLFSVQGLRNLGPTLDQWRGEWLSRRNANPDSSVILPAGTMEPAGYVVMQPNLYGGSVTRAYGRWLDRIPGEYMRVTGATDIVPPSVYDDARCFGIVKHYRSLMAMAHEARKPVFHLTSADGALGGHGTAARESGNDFRGLASLIARRIRLNVDSRTGPAGV